MPRKRKDRLLGAELPRIPSRAFPKTLASIALKQWDYICGGDYVVPPCPPKALLQAILEVAYLTATAAEENRFPRFNIVATASEGSGNIQENRTPVAIY
jgi:hypothetical protein